MYRSDKCKFEILDFEIKLRSMLTSLRLVEKRSLLEAYFAHIETSSDMLSCMRWALEPYEKAAKI